MFSIQLDHGCQLKHCTTPIKESLICRAARFQRKCLTLSRYVNTETLFRSCEHYGSSHMLYLRHGKRDGSSRKHMQHFIDRYGGCKANLCNLRHGGWDMPK